MATKIQDIRATNWQLSYKVIGEIASGIEDIRQSIAIILTTQKGSLALNPFFGSDIYKFIDMPVSIAAANIAAEIVDAINKWEGRVRIKEIKYEIQDFRIDYQLFFELLESAETTEILFFIDKRFDNIEGSDDDNRAFSGGFSFGFS